MPDMYFAYDRVDCRELGVQLEAPIELSAAKPNTESLAVPGRNGTLCYWDGSYTNRKATARCFVLRHNVVAYLAKIQNWLNMDTEYKRFEIPEEPDTYMMARVSDSGDIQVYQDTLASFDIKFDCMPQKFLKSGQETFELTNGEILHNEWMAARPLIEVYGSGSGTIRVGGTAVTITELHPTPGIYLDCETQNAYAYGLNATVANRNSSIQALEFPTLPHGDTKISWTSNITKVRITPRWWHL